MEYIFQVSLPHYRQQARDIDYNEDLRVQYILQNGTKEELRTIVYKRDYDRQRIKKFFIFLNLSALIGIFIQIVNSSNKGEEFIAVGTMSYEFYEFDLYANEQLESISISYNRSVPMIIFCQPGEIIE